MTDEQQQAMEDWHLNNLSIELQKYGDDKGKYQGRVTFTNKEYENITLRINEAQAGKFLAIIVDDLHLATCDITTHLLQNVRCMIEPPKEVKEIEGETNEG